MQEIIRLPKIEITNEAPLTSKAREEAWRRVWMEQQALKLEAARQAKEAGR